MPNYDAKWMSVLGQPVDRTCSYCGGTGRDYEGDCPRCDGSTYELNDAGEELMAFISRHLNLRMH